MAQSLFGFGTRLFWLKIFGLENLETSELLDVQDIFELIDLQENDMTIDDLLAEIAEQKTWCWGYHGEALDPKIKDKDQEESIGHDIKFIDDDLDDDPTENMNMEELFAFIGQEEADDYLLQKYTTPKELDTLYEFDLATIFPEKPVVVCLASFIILYSRNCLPEDSEDGTHLLRGFNLNSSSLPDGFAITIRQSLPS